ncbi:MAG: hypothetical protein JRI80_09580 [Deltaproteobacteria bacterium]|nr:hypothetical protein [Deltaproteobacteria bacterium]
MPSGLGWVDFAEDDRQKMLEVVRLFHESETRDELGLGVIRDAFSDYLFPGTSTVQTRARYFLVVPWIYMSLESKEVPSSKVYHRASSIERKLIYTLLEAGETDGVIGRVSKDKLQRLPSNIYWSGMGTLGIRLFPRGQQQYHDYLDLFYYLKKARRKENEEDEGEVFSSNNWHPGLPAPPPGFPEEAALDLTREEALYLQERILVTHPQSLMADLVKEREFIDADYIWEHSIIQRTSADNINHVTQAMNFSDMLHGAALLYNLMLSRKLENEEYISDYQRMMDDWAERIEARWSELQDWHREMDSFWELPAITASNIKRPIRSFIESWLAVLFQEGPGAIPASVTARNLILDREVKLKRNRSRLENQRALELWNGASGTIKLEYRWSNAKIIVRDIIKGLNSEE